MSAKDIYLLRHGDTGLQGRYVGSSDVSLSSQGAREVKKSCSFLSKVDFDTILCSPMKRCVETVAHLSCSCTVQFHDFLRETDFGHWEKKTFAEIAATDNKRVDAWVTNPDTFTFPGGESFLNFSTRIKTAEKYLYDTGGKTILVVCHGGVIRHLLCKLLKIPREHYLLFEVYSGAFSQVRLYPEGGVLTGFNLRG